MSNGLYLLATGENTAMDRPGPRRRPLGGGYARGDETRTRIIEAALRRFGEDGYARASTRQIAQEAGVNPPALQYYFENKEGLHFACAEYLCEHFRAAMQESYSRAEQIDQNHASAALDALCGILDALADYLFDTSEKTDWSAFMARGQGDDGNETGYRLLKKTVSEELHGHCFRLVGWIIGMPPAEPQVRVQTLAILGQLMVFHLSRSNALDRLNWQDFHGPRLQMLKEIVRAQTRAALRHQ
jgi:AcrR family transcriptional regulator